MTEARRASDRGDRLALEARSALLAHRYAEVKAALDTGTELEREIRAHAIAALPDAGPLLNTWRDHSPDDPDVHLLLAIRRLDDIPWLATLLEQQRTPEQQHYDEVESLWRAVEHLQWVLGVDAGRPVALVWMAAVAGALAWRGALPTEDFEVCVSSAEAAVPDSLVALRWRIHVADVVPDADGVALAEQDWPAGDPRHAEVVSAHVARYRDLLDDGREAAAAYWRREEVHASLVAANERLGSPVQGPAADDAATLMAFALPRTSEPRLAIPHFDHLQGRLLGWPWAMLRQPALAYAELEETARRWSVRALFRRR